jgi:hypothetical protein
MSSQNKMEQNPLAKIIGKSGSTRALKSLLSRISPTNLPVLITGESGVGKTLVARIIHELSQREGNFVSVDLGVIPSSLASAKLSGYRKGAFTNAKDTKGLFEIADNGTLYLDEITEANDKVSSLLLKFLKTGVISPLGDIYERHLNVRIIASTYYYRMEAPNRDLINILSANLINILPLRNRKEDILSLASHFLLEFNQIHNKKLSFSKATISALNNYSYPGNVRELQNIIQRAVILSGNKVLEPEDLGDQVFQFPKKISDTFQLEKEIHITRSELEHLKRTTISADPIWEGRFFPAESDYCFVLMPFSDFNDIQSVYENHIKPIIENKCELRCERADDIHDISGVMQSVWESINRARIIIAEMTGKNPNVFYELGIAHTLGKPVIMITQSIDYVPFDLKHLRCIVYEYKPGKINKLEIALEKTVSRVISSTFSSPSPKLRLEW